MIQICMVIGFCMLCFGGALIARNLQGDVPSNYRQSEVYAEAVRDHSMDKVGTRAPEFSGLTWVNSAPITLASLKGKTVLLHFWEGDCANCREHIDSIRQLQKEYASKGLIVLVIRIGEKDDDLVKQWDVRFPVAVDPRGSTVKKYWFDNTAIWTPGSFLIDRNGIIQWACKQRTLRRPVKEQCSRFSTLAVAIKKQLEN